MPCDVGFYGKLPSHGDFLRRRVLDAFVDAWDPGCRSAWPRAETALGDRWLDVYLTSPAWRFCLRRGRAGPDPVAGVMVPSVDRVGRYFSVTVVASSRRSASGNASPASAALLRGRRRLAVEAVSSDALDLDAFDEGVARAARAARALTVPPAVDLDPVRRRTCCRWRGTAAFAAGLPPDSRRRFHQVLSARLAAVFPGRGALVDRMGRVPVEPSSRWPQACRRPEVLPPCSTATWSSRRWRSVPARLRAAAVESESLVDDLDPAAISLRWRSTCRPRPRRQSGRVPRAAGRRCLGGGGRNGRAQRRRCRQPR